jgi:hypothetical protein
MAARRNTVVDIRPLLAKLRRVPGLLEAELKPKIEAQAKGFIRDIIKITPPASEGVSGPAARKQGEAAVSGDIARIYATPGAAYEAIHAIDPVAADGFWKLYREGDFIAAGKILRALGGREFSAVTSFSSFDGGTMHRRFRKRGRVQGSRVMQVVTNPRELNAYRKKRVGRVGTLAAGFLPAANKLGAPVPAWIRKAASATSGRRGSIRYESRTGQFVITMINSISYAQYQGMQRRADAVMRYRKAALRRQLPFILRAAARKAKLS